MNTIHKLLFIQRLLREYTMTRYVAALEDGDLDSIASIMQRAEKDATLEQMIFEFHATYQTEEGFLAMIQEESLMEFKEGIHKSFPRSELPAAEPASVPEPERPRSRYARWFQALAAALLVVCLAGGVLLYKSFQAGANPYNWCVSAGAPINVLGGTSAFNLVSALSPDDVWVVGSTRQGDQTTNSGQTEPLVEHWNGTRWSIIPTANTTDLLNHLASQIRRVANEITSLYSVAAISVNDVWAVGYLGVEQIDPGQSPSPASITRALIEHWDGSQWQVVSNPYGENQEISTRLNDVMALSADDVWAVGDASASNSTFPLAEHWDGRSWKAVQVPNSLKTGVAAFSAVTATSADNVWTVGTRYENNQGQPLAAHWDGRSWSVAALPGPLGGTLNGVTALSANNIWATGPGLFDAEGAASTPPLIEHWDGHQWNSVAGADVPGSILLTSAANGANDVWAVGQITSDQSRSGSFVNRPLVEHWDGRQWSSIPLSSPRYGGLNGVAIAGGRVWMVGFSAGNTGTSFSPLIESSC